MKIGLCSLHSNPLGQHTLRYLQCSKDLCDLLVVIVNSDKQVLLKGSCPFQPEEERLAIVRGLKCVDAVHLAIDDDSSVSKTIEQIVSDYTFTYNTLDGMFGKKRPVDFEFYKGGDRSPSDNPLPSQELEACNRLGVTVKYGVGGGKTGSSSSSLSGAFRWIFGKLNDMTTTERKEYFEKIGLPNIDLSTLYDVTQPRFNFTDKINEWTCK